MHGKVVGVTDYGAFVQIEPGVEGLVHVSEMSWSKRTKHPSKIVKVGDDVDVVVLEVKSDQRRISLGLKQTLPDPWEAAAEKYPVGTMVTGRIRNLADFGAFVEIEEGMEGLIHISDVSWTERIKHPEREIQEGRYGAGPRAESGFAEPAPFAGHQAGERHLGELVYARHKIGEVMKGKVARTTDFGAFVELAEGIEGLCHVSEIEERQAQRRARDKEKAPAGRPRNGGARRGTRNTISRSFVSSPRTTRISRPSHPPVRPPLGHGCLLDSRKIVHQPHAIGRFYVCRRISTLCYLLFSICALAERWSSPFRIVLAGPGHGFHCISNQTLLSSIASTHIPPPSIASALYSPIRAPTGLPPNGGRSPSVGRLPARGGDPSTTTAAVSLLGLSLPAPGPPALTAAATASTFPQADRSSSAARTPTSPRSLELAKSQDGHQLPHQSYQKYHESRTSRLVLRWLRAGGGRGLRGGVLTAHAPHFASVVLLGSFARSRSRPCPCRIARPRSSGTMAAKTRRKKTVMMMMMIDGDDDEASQGAPAKVPRVMTGRTCKHCGITSTPEWRTGPDGKGTLCNAYPSLHARRELTAV